MKLKKYMMNLFWSVLKKLVLRKRNFFKTPQLKDKYKKILIVRNDHLGDLILSLPAIYAIRKAYPDAHISVMVNESFKDIFYFYPFVNSIISYNKNWPILEKIKFFLKIFILRFDLSIDICHGKTLEMALITFFSFIPARIGFNVCKHGFLFNYSVFLDSDNIFETDICFNIAKILPNVKEIGLEDIKFDKQERVKKDDILIGINIGVAKENFIKAWDINKFSELINKIKKDFPKIKIIILGSKSELELLEKLKRGLNCDVISMVGKTSLKKLFYLMSFLDLVICNNTGIMQLAVLLKIPAIIINGPSSIKRWGPQNLKYNILITKNLECGIKDCNTKICDKDFYCIKGITVDDVYSAFKRQLNKRGTIKNGI